MTADEQTIPPDEEEGVWCVTEGDLSRQEHPETFRPDGVEKLTYNNPYALGIERVWFDGQYNIYDSVPGMESYSPLWQFNYVVVPRSYEPNTLRSEADCLQSGYPIEKSTIVEN